MLHRYIDTYHVPQPYNGIWFSHKEAVTYNGKEGRHGKYCPNGADPEKETIH